MEKETSCINSRAVFDYVRTHNNGDTSGLLGDLDPELDALPDPEGFLRDPNNWISCAVISKLYNRAKLILNDDMVAYRIAKHAVENISMGYAQSILLKALWSSRKALKHAQRLNDKFNRNKRVEVLELKRNRAVIRLHWNPEMNVSKDICLNNQGVYTFMPLVWGGKPAIVKEKCCFFKGAPFCEYRINWAFENTFHEMLSRFFTSKSVLMEIIAEMEEDKHLIEEKYEEVNRLNLELNHKIRQVIAIQETGKAILSILDLEQLLTVMMNLLANVCQINRALIMLINEKEGCLEYLHAKGFEGEVPDDVQNYRVPLDRVGNMLARVVSTGKSEYIPDVGSSALRKDNVLLSYGKPTSIYVVPLITRSKVIGIIAADAIDDGGGMPLETRETLRIFAPQIAIAIDNAKLYRTLQEQMLELKKSQALLSRAERFSLLGNLSARLAHEIKNPMTAIGTFIQLLPQKFDDEEFRNSFYRIALEETKRVNDLITELLNLVKTRESHFEPGDLHSLIDKMILLISPQCKAVKIEIVRSFDSSISMVWMDEGKMKEVVLNLLSNAVEFSPEKGRIEVITRHHVETKGTKSVCIEIRDNGKGIPSSMIESIFDPYFTTKHKSNMHSGTGLGLFIAHQNMQDHNGTIEVRSVVNEGTTFILTLPLAPPHKHSETLGAKE